MVVGTGVQTSPAVCPYSDSQFATTVREQYDGSVSIRGLTSG